MTSIPGQWHLLYSAGMVALNTCRRIANGQGEWKSHSSMVEMQMTLGVNSVLCSYSLGTMTCSAILWLRKSVSSLDDLWWGPSCLDWHQTEDRGANC